MAIDYNQYLSADQKRSILEQRLTQFAAEAYQHEINKQLAESTGDQALVDASSQALATIEAAMQLHQDELAKLG